MVRFYETLFSYDYSFPAVTLAYFLRYPNPYSRHVLSTDVIDRYVDPQTQRLHTVRLHLKRSKIPSGILKVLPKGILGSVKGSTGQSYILESSVVDVHEGWMTTESRNLEWTGVLSVIERQYYNRPRPVEGGDRATGTTSGTTSGTVAVARNEDGRTMVRTTVALRSRLGQGRLLGSRSARSPKDPITSDEEIEPPARKGLLSSWTTASVQGSIELIGVRRTRDQVFRSTEGMKLVLERLRAGGLVGVLEGMRRDARQSPETGGP